MDIKRHALPAFTGEEVADHNLWLRFKLKVMKAHASGEPVSVLITPFTEPCQSLGYRSLEGPSRYGYNILEGHEEVSTPGDAIGGALL